MTVSAKSLSNIDPGKVSVPDANLLLLPEKVLQFGTGVLLRGLPDFFIDKANRQGIFNGRIVVVKSTNGGDAAAFDRQDGLYTVCVRGLSEGLPVIENIICSSISRVLSAQNDWEAVLNCAQDKAISIIISNTTEVGIELVNEDINLQPPASYPAKLLAYLHHRYLAFEGSAESGMVIVPTELISDNGKKLKAIVLELSRLNELDAAFIEWLEKHNQFCSSLVDRIVPGIPSPEKKEAIEAELGYQDDLLTMCEVYSLWAIEGNESTKEVLSFTKVDEKSLVVAEDITLFKELKLRLLNGTHTLSCGVAFLAGFSTVSAAMEDKAMYDFIRTLMKDEIAPAIPFEIPENVSGEFANNVLDRFSNPSIAHPWINITLNYTSKIKMRVVQVLQQYVALFGTIPSNIATGFAAYLLFMKGVRKEGNKYFGEFNGNEYLINDEKAGWFFEQWQQNDPALLVQNVLSNATLWDADLSVIPSFAESVTEQLNKIMTKGMVAVINENLKVNQE